MILNECANQAELVRNSILQIEKAVSKISATQDLVTIAVSGGKSPILLFNELSKSTIIPWDKVIITLVDERFVETDNEASNEYLVKTHLLINNASAAKFIGLMPANLSETEALDNAQKIGKIDIAILGMGDDGHFASIFPCAKESTNILNLSNTNRYVITNPTTALYKRIGLSLNGVLEVPYTIINLAGIKKFNVFKEAKKGITNLYPISYVIAQHKNFNVFYSY